MTGQVFCSRIGLEAGHIIHAHSGDGKARDYEIIHPVGLGGGGEVWKAKSLYMPSDFVAVKFFAPAQKGSANSLTAKIETDRKRLCRHRLKFMNEIFAVREAPFGTTHPFRGAYLLSPTPYYSVEYRKGRTIFSLMQRRLLSMKQKIRIFDALCRSVEKLHKEMLHLDLKPDNVFVEQDINVLLLDLGSSSRISELMALKNAGNNFQHTQLFSAPEVDAIQLLSPASDVFSLGKILFYMLTGSFIKNDSDLLMLKKPMRRIVQKACERETNRRFQSAEQLREAFLHELSNV